MMLENFDGGNQMEHDNNETVTFENFDPLNGNEVNHGIIQHDESQFSIENIKIETDQMLNNMEESGYLDDHEQNNYDTLHNGKVFSMNSGLDYSVVVPNDRGVVVNMLSEFLGESGIAKWKKWRMEECRTRYDFT